MNSTSWEVTAENAPSSLDSSFGKGVDRVCCCYLGVVTLAEKLDRRGLAQFACLNFFAGKRSGGENMHSEEGWRGRVGSILERRLGMLRFCFGIGISDHTRLLSSKLVTLSYAMVTGPVYASRARQ